MIRPSRPSRTDSSDVLLSWDSLGFRVMVFGGLGLMWILQGRLYDQPWDQLILGEVGVLMPWAFLAPLVLYWGRRVQMDKLGLGRFLAAHLLGMLLVFIPFWVVRTIIVLVWSCFASGWAASRLTKLIPTQQNLLGSFLNVPFAYFLILLGSEAMKHAQARREEELQAGRLAGQLAEARLALLQRQLHPHFLFNALQAISTLLHRDPRTADGLLMRLSTLLRAMLEDASGQTLSVQSELELTRRYLEIEQVRFEDRLRVAWSVDASILDVQVPSLIVLPLVENAIRHGLSPKVGPGRLKISAGPGGSFLLLTVEDDGMGSTLPLRPGVGIGNTRARLEAMYGGAAGLAVDTRTEGGFRATIRIPLPEGRP